MNPKVPERDALKAFETLEFDVKHVPFSRKGSYLAISILKPKFASKEGLYLRHLRAGGKGPVFLIEPILHGKPARYIIKTTPYVLSLEVYNAEHAQPQGENIKNNKNSKSHTTVANNQESEIKLGRKAGGLIPEKPYGIAQFCFATPQTLHFQVKGQGFGLRFTMKIGSYDHIAPIFSGTRIPSSGSTGYLSGSGSAGNPISIIGWEVNSYTHNARFLLTPVEGKLQMNAPWNGLSCDHIEATFLPREGLGQTKQIIDCTQENPGIKTTVEGAIEEYVTEKKTALWVQDFEHSVKSVKSDFIGWLGHCPEPQCPKPAASQPESISQAHLPRTRKRDDLNLSSLHQGYRLATYITWSCMVRTEGFLPRPAMYMSKNRMANIWSWDHCFNAMAQIYKNPALAWDQFCIFFDRQHPSGVLPDYMNNRYATWSCCKPPIHGWALDWMIKRDVSGYITDDRLSEIYGPLTLWTKWWFRYRDCDKDGIPQYNHGNDSGWDNSTIFSQGVPVESPDLSALLVLQMETLAHIAKRLGNSRDSLVWKTGSQQLLDRMISHFWNGEKLNAILLAPHPGLPGLPGNNRIALPSSGKVQLDTQSDTGRDTGQDTWTGNQRRLGGQLPEYLKYLHQTIESQSLLPYVSIVLGKRLPVDVRRYLVSALATPGKFLTHFGLATESIDSPYYESDGYWRGPIWAPATMLIVEGLCQAGEETLSKDIARRFCKMAATSGMAENFDALSGKGLQDRAFTWTSSVYMILAHEYL